MDRIPCAELSTTRLSWLRGILDRESHSRRNLFPPFFSLAVRAKPSKVVVPWYGLEEGLD